MVSHADDREGHDHEDAAKAHGFREAVISMAVISPAEDSLGKECQKKGHAAGDTHLCQHVEVHVVGVEDEHSLFLDEEIIVRIGQEIGPPAHAQKRMLLYHGHGAFPQSKAQVHGRIFPGKEGEEPFHHLPVVEGQHRRHQKEEEAEPFIIKESKPQHDGCQADPGAPGIGKGQA